MNKKTDMQMVLAALDDELGGVQEYQEIAEHCKDSELRNLALAIAEDEKKHVQQLMQLMSKGVQQMLTR